MFLCHHSKRETSHCWTGIVIEQDEWSCKLHNGLCWIISFKHKNKQDAEDVEHLLNVSHYPHFIDKGFKQDTKNIIREIHAMHQAAAVFWEVTYNVADEWLRLPGSELFSLGDKPPKCGRCHTCPGREAEFPSCWWSLRLCSSWKQRSGYRSWSFSETLSSLSPFAVSPCMITQPHSAWKCLNCLKYREQWSSHSMLKIH